MLTSLATTPCPCRRPPILAAVEIAIAAEIRLPSHRALSAFLKPLKVVYLTVTSLWQRRLRRHRQSYDAMRNLNQNPDADTVIKWTWMPSDKVRTSLFVWTICTGWSFLGDSYIKGGSYYSSNDTKYETQLSSQDIIIAQYRSQGHLLFRITTSIDTSNHCERPV